MFNMWPYFTRVPDSSSDSSSESSSDASSDCYSDSDSCVSDVSSFESKPVKSRTQRVLRTTKRTTAVAKTGTRRAQSDSACVRRALTPAAPTTQAGTRRPRAESPIRVTPDVVAVVLMHLPQDGEQRVLSPWLSVKACNALLKILGRPRCNAAMTRALEAPANFTRRTAASADADDRQEANVLEAVQARGSLETVVATDRAKRMLQGADAAADAFKAANGRASPDFAAIVTLLERLQWRNPKTNRLNMLRNAFE